MRRHPYLVAVDAANPANEEQFDEDPLPIQRLKRRGYVVGACVRPANGMPIPGDIIALTDDGRVKVCWPSGIVEKCRTGSEVYLVDRRTGERIR